MKSPKQYSPASLRPMKRIGEWAEIRFMAEATGRGLTVLKPYGDSARFDFAVSSGGPLHRVQVKSTSSMTCSDAYPCNYHTQRKPYSPQDHDFLAAYVIPCDAWYIIPAEAIRLGTLMLYLYPHRRRSRGRWENYREAWNLLGQPSRV
ncbi:MAG: group I intron-associated PD-(D/E)XK endonuclease [Terriglobales bacterium]